MFKTIFFFSTRIRCKRSPKTHLFKNSFQGDVWKRRLIGRLCVDAWKRSFSNTMISYSTPVCNRPHETLSSGLIQFTQWKFCLPDTRRIVCFYPVKCFASPVTFCCDLYKNFVPRYYYLLLTLFIINYSHYYHWQKKSAGTGNRSRIKKSVNLFIPLAWTIQCM